MSTNWRNTRESIAKTIAELHAAGLSNEKIGYLLPQFGAREAISKRTVRRWALGETEPSTSEHEALKRLHAHLYDGTKTPPEVMQGEA